MTPDIIHLMNEIKRLHPNAVNIKSVAKSLALSINPEGRPHVSAILALCKKLVTDELLESLSFDYVPMNNFDELVEFLACVLEKNHPLQTLHINFSSIFTPPEGIAHFEERVTLASDILTTAMKNNVHLRSFIFCVPLENRVSSYIKEYVDLSPINKNICDILDRNNLSQRTSIYSSSSSAYFSSRHRLNLNQVTPIEFDKTPQPTESLCHCIIS